MVEIAGKKVGSTGFGLMGKSNMINMAGVHLVLTQVQA